MESETMLSLRKKSPLPEAQRRFEPVTLYHTGQRAKNITNWAILAPQIKQLIILRYTLLVLALLFDDGF